MKTFGERLRNLRESLGRSRAEVSAATGISEPSLYVYESDRQVPTANVLYRLCKYFNISADYLLGLTKTKTSYKKPSTFFETVPLYPKKVFVQKHFNADFALVMNDNSMFPNFCEGDILYCRTERKGNLLVLQKGNAFLVRVVIELKGKKLLKPLNIGWEEKIIPNFEFDNDYSILGEVVGSVSKLKGVCV